MRTADLAVLISYFLILAAISWVARQREKNARSYLLGDRQLPWWAVLLSIIGTEISALTFVGVPVMAYKGDWTYMQLALGAIGGRILVARFFVPAYYRANVVSIYEFLAQRYGPLTRNVAVTVFLVTRVLMSGVRLFAGALILQAALALTPPQAVLLVALLGLLYTIKGGIKAVIWTESLQVMVMIVGAAAAVLYLLKGLPPDWMQALPPDKLKAIDPRLDPTVEFTLWAGLIGTTITNTAIFGTDYDMVQRMLTAPDSRKSRLAVIGSGIADIPIAATFLLIGTLLYAHYHFFPDPTLGEVKSVFPHFILTQMPPGLAGLLIAAVLSVVLSSYQSALTALAGSFVVDLYRPYLSPDRSEAHYLKATKAATSVFALLLALTALASQNVERLLPLGLEIGTYFYGALLAIFAFALARRRLPSDKVAVWAIPISIAVVATLKLTTRLAFPWFVSLGALTGLVFLQLAGPRAKPSEPAARGESDRPDRGTAFGG